MRSDYMNYAQIRTMDIANGEGIGTALFVSGCPFHCNGCFNPETWDYNYGTKFTEEVLKAFIKMTDKPYITRISILGGEPLALQNLETITNILFDLSMKFTDKKIWIYTGFTYESLNKDQLKAVSYADVLVDGQFEINKKDFNLKFRGSSNQRVINIQRTIKESKIILEVD